jgi:hypothetical protein
MNPFSTIKANHNRVRNKADIQWLINQIVFAAALSPARPRPKVMWSFPAVTAQKIEKGYVRT